MEKIPCDSLIYRAIKSKSWIRNGVSAKAFILRRETKDGTPEKELSVITKAECTKDKCYANQNTCFGEIKLLTEIIRQLGFDVVDRKLENNQYHAVIVDLPLNTDDTIEEAERIAGLIAKKVVGIQNRSQ